MTSEFKNEADMKEVEVANSSEHGPEEIPEQHRMNRTIWLACIALGLSYTTAIQQQSSTASIVRHIDSALGPTTYYNWIISGHSITTACILPIAGGLSDIFGRRYFFIGGCLFSMIGTGIALAAKDIPTVIAGMVFKGVGSGAQQLSLAAIGELVPNKHRGTAQAILDLVGMPWMVFGALIGNSMVKHHALSFRVNFIIGILLNALTIICIWFWYHPPAGRLPEGMSRIKAFLSLDWLGILFLAAAISLTLVGISLGGTTYSWKSAPVIALMTLGLLSWPLLYIWESRFAKSPFFSPELFEGRVPGKSNGFAIILLLSLVGGMSLYSQAAFFTQETQLIFTTDPTEIGLAAIPTGAGGAVGGFFGAILIGKAKIFKPNLLIFYGSSIKLVADGLFTIITPGRFALLLGSGFMAMFGIGILMLASVVTTQLLCQDKHIGLATLILGSVRSVGGSLAVTIFSQVMQNEVKKDSKTRVIPALIQNKIPPSSIPNFMKLLMGGRAKQTLSLPGVTPEALAVAERLIKLSWTVAFKRVFQVSMAFTALAVCAALFVPDITGNMTENVAVKLRNDEKREEGKQV